MSAAELTSSSARSIAFSRTVELPWANFVCVCVRLCVCVCGYAAIVCTVCTSLCDKQRSHSTSFKIKIIIIFLSCHIFFCVYLFSFGFLFLFCISKILRIKQLMKRRSENNLYTVAFDFLPVYPVCREKEGVCSTIHW